MKAANSVKQMMTTKIKLSNNSQLKACLNEYFNNPKSYLTNKIENNTILLQSKSSKKRFFVSLNKTNTNKNPNTLNSKIYRTRMLMSRKSTGKNISYYSSKDSQNSQYKTIDNIEIEQIYAYFAQKKNNNSEDKVNLLKDFGKVFEKNNSPALFVQHQALIEHSKAKEMNNLLTQYISKNSKKAKEDLLMRRSGYFRYKQEIKNDIDKDIKKKEPTSILKWPSTLRNPMAFHSSSISSHYYINTGSNEYPKWQFIIENNPNQGERVIMPTMLNDKEKKDILQCLDNSYLHQRVSSSTINQLKKNLIQPSLNTMIVQGKDLLQFESELTKTMKKKKVIHRSDSEPNKLIPILFEKKIQYSNLIQCNQK